MHPDPELPPWPFPYPQEPFPLKRRIEGTQRTFGQFLSWAYSDVLDSQQRGILAEYLVMDALGQDLPNLSGDFYDLRYRGGVQVKASSAAQRWKSEKVHRISFGTRAVRGSEFVDADLGTTRLTAETSLWGATWVFAVHVPSTVDEPDIAREEVLDARTWRYWAGRPTGITTSRVSLLAVIANLGPSVRHDDLKAAVDEVMDRVPDAALRAWQARPTMAAWLEAEQMHLVPQGALDAVEEAVARVGLERSGQARVAFSPGVVRIRPGGGRGIMISAEHRADLAAGAVRLLRWAPGSDAAKGSWADASVVAWTDLPHELVTLSR
jgi:hypothetical protein